MESQSPNLQAVKDAEHNLYQAKVDYICCVLNTIMDTNKNMDNVMPDVKDFILDTYTIAQRINGDD